MEEVNNHGPGLLIVNSEPIILNDPSSFNSLLNNNTNILQGALSLIDSKTIHENIKLEEPLLLDHPGVKLDPTNIIQLSLDDLSKLGLQLSFDSSETCDVIKPPDSDVFLSGLSKDKVFISDTLSPQIEPQISLNVTQPLNIANFNSILDENALKSLSFQQLEVLTPLDNDMTYTLQLDPAVNPSLPRPNDLILGNIDSKKIQQIIKINKPNIADIKQKSINALKLEDNKLIKIPKQCVVRTSDQGTVVRTSDQGTTTPQPQRTASAKVSTSVNTNKTKKICVVKDRVQSDSNEHKIIKLTPDNKSDKQITLSGGVVNRGRSDSVSRPQTARSTGPPMQSLSVSAISSPPISNDKPNKVKKLTQAQLQQIADYFGKNRDDEAIITNPSTFYDTETNTKIICRVVYPEDFENGKKNGKSKTQSCKTNKLPDKDHLNDNEVLTVLSFSRTRSGRLSRPPKHITANDNSTTPSEKQSSPSTINNSAGSNESTVSSSESANQKDKVKAPKEVGQPQKKGISWKKRIKLKNGVKTPPLSQVLGKYSETEIEEAIKNKISHLPLWHLLLLKVSSSEEKDKVRVLCDELAMFAKSVSQAAHHFLKPISPQTADTCIMLKNEVLCALFQKSMGNYSSDSEALMRLYGDKRKRDDDDNQANKKTKCEQVELKEETLVDQVLPGNERVKLSPSEARLDDIGIPEMSPMNGLSPIKDKSLDLDLGESVDELVNQRLASLQGELISNKTIGDQLLTNLLLKTEDKKIDKDKLVKGSIDLDLGESVDELVNQRLASLTEDIIPSLPSRALGDDVLVGLLSDTTSIFSHIEKPICNTEVSSGYSIDKPSNSPSLYSHLDKPDNQTCDTFSPHPLSNYSNNTLKNFSETPTNVLYSNLDKGLLNSVNPEMFSIDKPTQNTDFSETLMFNKNTLKNFNKSSGRSYNELSVGNDVFFPKRSHSLSESHSNLFSLNKHSSDTSLLDTQSSLCADKPASSPDIFKQVSSQILNESSSIFSSLDKSYNPATSSILLGSSNSTSLFKLSSPEREVASPNLLNSILDKPVTTQFLEKPMSESNNILNSMLEKRISSQSTNTCNVENPQSLDCLLDKSPGVYKPSDKSVTQPSNILNSILEKPLSQSVFTCKAPIQTTNILSSMLAKPNTSKTNSSNSLDKQVSKSIYKTSDKQVGVFKPSKPKTVFKTKDQSQPNNLFEKHSSVSTFDRAVSSKIFDKSSSTCDGYNSIQSSSKSSIDNVVAQPFNSIEKQQSANLLNSILEKSMPSQSVYSLDKCAAQPTDICTTSPSANYSVDVPTKPSRRVTSTSSRSLLRKSRNSQSDNNKNGNDVSSSTCWSSVSSSSDLFSPLDKRVSESTQDLIKSLENLSAEIPAPSSSTAALQDFSIFSQHLSRESKTAIGQKL